MGCRHCFVYLVEEIVGEGGSRSSSQVHEHDSYQLVSQQNVAIQVFWSRCQPRLTLSARDLHHGKQQVSPFYRDLFRLLKLLSDLHERNVDEMFAQSRQQLGARDFHHGKQQVSPFYRVSQLFHEKNVFRFPENGALHFEGKQQVSPFYHDLGLDWVGLIGNFLLIAQLLLLVVEQLLNPNLSSSHVSRKSLEEDEVTHILSRIWLLQFPSEQLSGYNKLGVIREEW